MLRFAEYSSMLRSGILQSEHRPQFLTVRLLLSLCAGLPQELLV